MGAMELLNEFSILGELLLYVRLWQRTIECIKLTYVCFITYESNFFFSVEECVLSSFKNDSHALN